MEVVRRVKPWRTILTHFSHRLPFLPEVLDEYEDEKIMLAFDQMRLEVSDFEWAYKFIGVYRSILSGDGQRSGNKRNYYNDL